MGRFVLVGMGSVLEVAPGCRPLDQPDHPVEYREFALGHVEQLAVLATTDLDRVVLDPSVDYFAAHPDRLASNSFRNRGGAFRRHASSRSSARCSRDTFSRSTRIAAYPS